MRLTTPGKRIVGRPLKETLMFKQRLDRTHYFATRALRNGAFKAGVSGFTGQLL
jgi:hypothetical protein